MRFDSKQELMEWLEKVQEDGKTTWFAVGITDEDVSEAIRSCTGKDATEDEKEHVINMCIIAMEEICAFCNGVVRSWMDDYYRMN